MRQWKPGDFTFQIVFFWRRFLIHVSIHHSGRREHGQPRQWLGPMFFNCTIFFGPGCQVPVDVASTATGYRQSTWDWGIWGRVGRSTAHVAPFVDTVFLLGVWMQQHSYWSVPCLVLKHKTCVVLLNFSAKAEMQGPTDVGPIFNWPIFFNPK